MAAIVSSTLRQYLIDIINRNNNVNYTISDIIDIRFTLCKTSILMNDSNRFDIEYDIRKSIENK